MRSLWFARSTNLVNCTQKWLCLLRSTQSHVLCNKLPTLCILHIIIEARSQKWFWLNIDAIYAALCHCITTLHFIELFSPNVAAECILPGISIFLEKLLARERISNELDSIRQCYVEILRSRNSTESAVSVRKKVEALDLKLDSNTKLGKFGRIREKRLINIRQASLCSFNVLWLQNFSIRFT